MRSVMWGLVFLGWQSMAMTPEQAFEAGKAVGNSGKQTANAQVGDATGHKHLPYYNQNAQETGHFQGGRQYIGGKGSAKLAGCKGYRASSAFEQQECDAINFMSKNPDARAKFDIGRNDPLVKGSKDHLEASSLIKGSAHQSCRVETTKIPATSLTETCTETQTLAQTSCSRRLVVTCDPERDGCDQGGIVPGSWAGDMATSFNPDGAGNYLLQFGTIANDYWKGWGQTYDRTLTFDLRDVGLISRFALTYAAFDDWLMVKVNGTVVYVGPKGGDRLEIYTPPVIAESSATRFCHGGLRNKTWRCMDAAPPKGNVVTYPSCSVTSHGWNCRGWNQFPGQTMVTYCETCFSQPELSTSWKLPLNIDLKPYLKNGSNTIFMRTIVAGAGEGAIQITTRQVCPRNCYDHWDSSECDGLEARTR